MATIKLYAIHDQAVNEFIGPEAARTHGEAERRFTENVNNKEMGVLHNYPAQFALFWVGEYNTENGTLIPLKEGPQQITNGIQVKKKKRRP